MVVREPGTPCSIPLLLFFELGGGPNTFQNRRVSSAAAETMVHPSGEVSIWSTLCRDIQTVSIETVSVVDKIMPS